jgi:hypothetical protein
MTAKDHSLVGNEKLFLRTHLTEFRIKAKLLWNLCSSLADLPGLTSFFLIPATVAFLFFA